MLNWVVSWPEDTARRYREAGVWTGTPLLDHVKAPALIDPTPVALIDGDRHWSRAELWSDVERRAAGLHGIGIDPGHRVIVQLPNSADFVITFLALLWVGAIPILALPGHRAVELTHLAETGEATAIVVSSGVTAEIDFTELAARVQRKAPSLRLIIVDGHRVGDVDLDQQGASLPPHRPQGHDVALLLLSGGTTGLPKLIPRTHDDYVYNIRKSSEVSEFDDQTRYLVALPAGHNFPLGCPGLLGALGEGGCVIMARSPSVSVALGIAAREKPTAVAVVPAVAISWMDAQDTSALESLQVLQVGGARMNPEAARRVGERLGCTLQQVFGMAEGLLNYTRLDDPDDVIINTQGRPVSEWDEIMVVDEQGNAVQHGEVGELLTRGPYTIRGYLRAPEHNLRSFTPDGFYRTGDLVRVTPEGNLIVEGRSRDHINRGGEKISAEEIENHALAHPSVVNAAAVGIPDSVMGEKIGLFAVVRDDLTLDEMRSHFRQRDVATFKYPDSLTLLDGLPVTNVGKVDKSALRSLLTPTKGK